MSSTCRACESGYEEPHTCNDPDLDAALHRLLDKWGDIEAMNLPKPQFDCESHEEALAAFGFCANELQSILNGRYR